MILDVLNIIFIVLIAIITTYLVRHYIFTITVLRRSKSLLPALNPKSAYEPTVSILIPAHNEEKVIGNLPAETRQRIVPTKQTGNFGS